MFIILNARPARPAFLSPKGHGPLVARRIIEAQHEAVEYLAEQLMERPLSGDEVREILLRQPRLRLITETKAQIEEAS